MIYETIPPLVSVSRTRNSYHTTINFIIEEVENGCNVESVTIKTEHPIRKDDYGTIVTAIIRYKYSSDDVEAVINNYLLSGDAAEMNDLQQWRKFAKDKAKEVLKYVECADRG